MALDGILSVFTKKQLGCCGMDLESGGGGGGRGGGQGVLRGRAHIIVAVTERSPVTHYIYRTYISISSLHALTSPCTRPFR